MSAQYLIEKATIRFCKLQEPLLTQAIEIRESFVSWSMVGHTALRQQCEGVKQFEDGIARLVNGEDYNPFFLLGQSWEGGRKREGEGIQHTHTRTHTHTCTHACTHTHTHTHTHAHTHTHTHTHAHTHPFNSLMTDTAVCASNPVVGSSRNRTWGSMINSIPMLVLFLSPPDTPRMNSLPTW